MTYEEAVARLRNHSNLDNGDPACSILYSLGRADRDGAFPLLATHLADIFACFAVANIELNGKAPSQKVGYVNKDVVFDLMYSISGIIAGLLGYHRRWSQRQRFPTRNLELLRDAALKIAMAWDMLLAGDHDDLVADFKQEWRARYPLA